MLWSEIGLKPPSLLVARLGLATAMVSDLQADIDFVKALDVVPTILQVVCRTTGMGFAAVARVTEGRWIACSVLDEIDFGLPSGGELKVDTTICHEIRQHQKPVVIDEVAADEEWRHHPTPKMYGFQSYISVPLILSDGTFFGTLCAIDPQPRRLRNPTTIGMFKLFADLIVKNLDGRRKLFEAESALTDEREQSSLREQFMAVLGHDLRSPLRAISCYVDLLRLKPLDENSAALARSIRQSATRMSGLIDNLLDLTRGRLASGLPLARNADEPLKPVLQAVVDELKAGYPEREIQTQFLLDRPVNCDRIRIAQLLSNLLGNALAYGSPAQPVCVKASGEGEKLELSVSNEGPPIPVESQKHLFEPFYRSSESGSREGLGLGLFISNEIAKAHGGVLTVQSDEHLTVFTFSMPAA